MRYTTRIAGLLGPWLGIAVGVAFLSSCEITAPLPTGAEAFTPLENYGLWWGMVQQCSGKTRPMSDIDWYVAPGENFQTGGASAVGMYTSESHRIVIAQLSLRDGQVVRHEMLHALLQLGKGELEHPAEYFLRRCGALVHCRQACMETSGPVAKPPASAPLRSPSLLEVTVELDSVARRSAYPLLGYVPVTVRARNPNDFGFAVRSPGYSGHFVTFEMRLTPPQTIPTVQTVFLVETDDPMSAYFAPGETKTHVFDVYLPITGAGYGNWAAASGFYGSSMITPTTFRYTP